MSAGIVLDPLAVAGLASIGLAALWALVPTSERRPRPRSRPALGGPLSGITLLSLVAVLSSSPLVGALGLALATELSHRIASRAPGPRSGRLERLTLRAGAVASVLGATLLSIAGGGLSYARISDRLLAGDSPGLREIGFGLLFGGLFLALRPFAGGRAWRLRTFLIRALPLVAVAPRVVALVLLVRGLELTVGIAWLDRVALAAVGMGVLGVLTAVVATELRHRIAGLAVAQSAIVLLTLGDLGAGAASTVARGIAGLGVALGTAYWTAAQVEIHGEHIAERRPKRALLLVASLLSMTSFPAGLGFHSGMTALFSAIEAGSPGRAVLIGAIEVGALAWALSSVGVLYRSRRTYPTSAGAIDPTAG